MFKFRLSKLSDHRARLEKEAKKAYVERMAQRVECEHEIDAIRVRRSELGRVPVTSVLMREELGRNFAKAEDEERRARAALAVLQNEEEVAASAWIHSKRELQVVEKLREKAFADWQLQETRREQNELDEWAVLRRAA